MVHHGYKKCNLWWCKKLLTKCTQNKFKILKYFFIFLAITFFCDPFHNAEFICCTLLESFTTQHILYLKFIICKSNSDLRRVVFVHFGALKLTFGRESSEYQKTLYDYHFRIVECNCYYSWSVENLEIDLFYDTVSTN